MLGQDPWDWRALWLSGLADLQAMRYADAQASFNAVYQQVPGELAPKLALAVACERGGQPDIAESLYSVCAQTDAAYAAPAAFGIARIRAQRADTRGAVAALDLVPSTSRGFGESRRLRAEVLLASAGGSLATLDQAMKSVDGVRMDTVERESFTVKVLERALALVSAGAPAGGQVGAVAADERSLRGALEHSYRALAREAPSQEERVAMVDRANQVRRWSMT